MPNVITTQVPVTRQVAVQSVRRVTYNVTRMQTEIEHRRVAINRVDMVPEKIVLQRPVTVMTQVPIGTTVAWIPAGSLAGGSSTATALGPTPDPISQRQRDLHHAERFGEKKGLQEGIREGKEIEKDKFRREKDDDLRRDGFGPGAEVIPQRKAGDSSSPQQVSQVDRSSSAAGGWVSHRRLDSVDVQMGYRGVSVADTKQ